MAKIVILIPLLFVTLLIGCTFAGIDLNGFKGSGVVKTEKRDLAPFTSIESSGFYDISVTSQATQSLEISADDNLIPLILTEVKGSTLSIRNDKGISPRNLIKIRISVPDIKSVSSSGASKIQISSIKKSL